MTGTLMLLMGTEVNDGIITLSSLDFMIIRVNYQIESVRSALRVDSERNKGFGSESTGVFDTPT